jgi:hypothetical protein
MGKASSWLNSVERFFAETTRKRIHRGVFKSVHELKQAITDYLDNHNGRPKPYVWTKTAVEIFQQSRPCETSVGITALGARKDR